MSMEEKKRASSLTYKDPSGVFKLDEVKLRRYMEAEGITLTDVRSESVRNPGENEVLLASLLQLQARIAAGDMDVLGDADADMGVLLRRTFANPEQYYCCYRIYTGTTHQSVMKWAKGIERECVVCFDECRVPVKSFKTFALECGRCGVHLCIGCFVDLTLIADIEMTFACPNCRLKADDFMDNWYSLEDVLRTVLERKECKLARGFTIQQLAFFHDTFGVDLKLSRTRVRSQLRDTLRFVENFPKRTYAAIQEFCRKKKVASASAESGGLVTVSSDGCANCGKRFWDKSDWRRAPKCPKCKRTAYCSSKCRKKHRKTHRKTHASECRAAAPKRKSKAKKKPIKGGCAPY